jgi:hypothetical protein
MSFMTELVTIQDAESFGWLSQEKKMRSYSSSSQVTSHVSKIKLTIATSDLLWLVVKRSMRWRPWQSKMVFWFGSQEKNLTQSDTIAAFGTLTVKWWSSAMGSPSDLPRH